MQESFSPLFLVESIANQFAGQARDLQLQMLGFAMPELPRRVCGNAALIEAAQILLAEKALESVTGIRGGAVMVEMLTGRKHDKDTLRVAVSNSRTGITLAEAREIAKCLLEEQTASGSLSDVLEELGTTLEVDKCLLGRATRFFFSLPLQIAHANGTDMQLSQQARSLKMFLVANDPTPNRVIPYYARYDGAEFYGAPTGRETIVELARIADPPIKILIVAPPIEDLRPTEIVSMVRESDIPQPKMLYIAPWDDPADRLNHMEAGFDDTLAKPFTKKQLFDALERLAGCLPVAVQSKPLVLIVEDNPINAQLALFQLSRIGFDAEIVTNGREALNALKNQKYVAVLMDLQMPGLDGIEATKRIRSLERAKNAAPIPIIALTANPDRKREAIEAGCTDFLTKPTRMQQLKAALQTHVQPQETH